MAGRRQTHTSAIGHPAAKALEKLAKLLNLLE
jgi:hypothetical protein